MTETTYLGFKILVSYSTLTVLDRDGTPVKTVTTMEAARRVIRRLRRAEREAA